MSGKALELTRKPNKNKNNTLDSLSQEIQKKPGSVKWILVFLLATIFIFLLIGKFDKKHSRS